MDAGFGMIAYEFFGKGIENVLTVEAQWNCEDRLFIFTFFVTVEGELVDSCFRGDEDALV